MTRENILSKTASIYPGCIKNFNTHEFPFCLKCLQRHPLYSKCTVNVNISTVQISDFPFFTDGTAGHNELDLALSMARL